MSLPDSLMLPSKTRHAITAAFLGMLLVGLSLTMSCTGPGCAKEDEGRVEAAAHLLFEPVEATADENTVRVHFAKGKVYELVFVDQVGDDESPAEPADLCEVDRGLRSWGARRVGSFRVLASTRPGHHARWIHFLEWPDADARFLAKDDDLCLADQVTSPFDAQRSAVFRTTADSVVVFRHDKVYEFAGMTLHPGVAARASLHRFHQRLTPIQRNYGGRYPLTILDLEPLDPIEDGGYSHERQTLIQWDSLEDLRRLRSNDDYRRRALPLRDKAVRRSDSWTTEFVRAG